MELFEAQRAMEEMRAPFFLMYDNVSKETGSKAAKDLTKRPKNQLVMDSDFMFDADNKLAEPFEAHVEHAMLDQIKLARLVAYVLWENAFGCEDKDTKWRNVVTCCKYVATFGICLHKMVKTRQDIQDMSRHVSRHMQLRWPIVSPIVSSASD